MISLRLTGVRPAHWLCALSIVTLLLFGSQRMRSPFLRAERERDAAAQLAAQYQVPTADVLALREDVGVVLGDEPWPARVARWKATLELGPTRRAAAERFCGDAIAAVRLLSVAERFAARLP